MKKKLLTIALIATMMLSIIACGGKGDAESSNTSDIESQVQEQKNELGAMCSLCSFSQDGKYAYVYMNFPVEYSNGRELSYAHMTYDTQDTETIALIYGQSALDYMTIAPEYGIPSFTLDNMMDTHSSYIVDSIEANYGGIYADYEMQMAEGELVDVNGVNMNKHTGTLTYTKEGTPVEKSAVAYVVPVSNGTYVIVIVCSPDSEKAESDADFIVQTIRETEEFE